MPSYFSAGIFYAVMTTTEKQYAYYLSQLGYSGEFFPEKSMFFVKELNTYFKLCDNPAPPETVAHAITASKKHTIVLLEGALTFRTYRLFRGGEEVSEILLVVKGNKFSPFYYNYDFEINYFTEEAKIISMAITGKDIECHRCGSVNDFTVSKPSLHYKATCQCGAYITNISENKPSAIYFGKYKGRMVSSMQSDEELRYLEWGIGQGLFKGKLKADILEGLQKV